MTMQRRQFAEHAAGSLTALSALGALGSLATFGTGCAQRPAAALPGKAPVLPALRLAPSQLATERHLAQRLAVSAMDGPQASPHLVDVQLELDRDSLRLAGFALGQRVLLVQWDGRHLEVQRHPRLPQEVDVARVLRDMTLLYWPAAAIRAALPAPWAFVEVPYQRQLLQAGTEWLRLSWQGDLACDSRIEILNQAERYRLVIESRPAGAPA
ncbi:MAG: DUF3261 domain-containing protein [Comamonadaceae bacterium]|nr:MAG: DUF3261 domain-containing protein [Comamonadaceae bacterium]